MAMPRACILLVLPVAALCSDGVLPLPPIDPATIVNIGKGIWDILKESKVTADVTNTTTAASGVPKGTSSWTDIEGWTPSAEHRFSFSMHDPLGIPFLSYDYSISFLHSGSYNGKGKYLAEVRLVPEKIWLNWGAGSLNAHVEIREVLNSGTKESPVAGITVVHHFTHSNIFQTTEHEDVFFVKGTGEMICQSGPSCSKQQETQAPKAVAVIV
mmetsp:Transcript_105762/g.256948  ORF Transcript_105762/g.256948 Transcript_105762/m.256948 type:complete len:213 (-) Transcript_105762:316-954(-)